MHALLALQRGRMCWCDMAIGNPMVTEHTPPCRNARQLFMGESKGGDKREVAPSNAVPGGKGPLSPSLRK